MRPLVTPLRVALALALACCAAAQHGVIREYAALAPAADATPLRPLFDAPLTDVSITAGHDGAYYLTGSTVKGESAAFSSRTGIWRSTDLRSWRKLREVETGGRAVQSPEIHYIDQLHADARRPPRRRHPLRHRIREPHPDLPPRPRQRAAGPRDSIREVWYNGPHARN
jgi:hypothetical protein